MNPLIIDYWTTVRYPLCTGPRLLGTIWPPDSCDDNPHGDYPPDPKMFFEILKKISTDHPPIVLLSVHGEL